MNGKPWTSEAQDTLKRMATAGYTNAEVQTHIKAKTGVEFSLFTISRHRAALGLQRPRPPGNNRALRRWRAIMAVA